MSTCINNPNESSTTKINKHTPSGYSILTSCSFDESKNKLNYYRGKDCMKKFCKDLKENATRIINYEKEKIIPLTKEEKINYNDCLGENTEKYSTFSVPLKKKIENKNLEITYKIKFIDSFRFM